MQDAVIKMMNVYNLRENNHRIQTWKEIIEILNIVQEKIIFLDDFNVYHFVWNEKKITSELQSEHLLNVSAMKNFYFFIFCEILIWKKKHQQNVIDLTFITEKIRQNMKFCKLINKWVTVQNYISVNIQINIWS